MTSKLVVNTIEADTGISSVSFASSISMDSTSKFHFSAAGVDIGADTNINRPASGVIGFNINSSEKVRINSNGQLGIGTNNPTQLIEVQNRSTGTVCGLNVGTQYGNAHFGGYNNYPAIMNSGNQPLIYCDTNNDRTVLFGDTVGFGTTCAFRVNNAERARIDSGGRLLVGTNTSRGVGDVTAKIQLEGNGFAASSLSLISNAGASAGNTPHLTLGKSRGSSTGSNTIVASGDALGQIQFAGADGTDCNTVAASIIGRVDGTPGSNSVPGYLTFNTAAASAVPTERLRIASDGIITHTGKSGAAANPAIDPLTSFVLNDAEARLQLCATNSGNNAAAIILSNESKHFIIHQRGPSQSNNFEIGYGDEASPTDINNQATPYFRINTSGHVLTPKNPRFSRARQTGWVTIAGQNTVIAFDQTLSADPSGSYNASNGRFTAPVAGSYCFLLLMYTRRDDGSQGDQGWYMNTYIRKNGSSPAYSNNIQHYFNAGDQDTTSNCHMMLDLAQNDYVDVIMNASGTNFRYYGYHCTFSGWLVG